MEEPTLSELRNLSSSEIDNLKVEAEGELKKLIHTQVGVEIRIAEIKIEENKLVQERRELEPVLLKSKAAISGLRTYISQLRSLFFSTRNTEN